MKTIITLFALLMPVPVLAIFSAFSVVTPGTEHEEELNIRAIHNKDLKRCKVKLSAYGYDSKHAWLVVSSRPLSEKEQELRDFVWGESPQPNSVELFEKLSLIQDRQNNYSSDKKLEYTVSLKSELASRSYIYIDFPSPVLDGGFYYSIPIGNYCGIKSDR